MRWWYATDLRGLVLVAMVLFSMVDLELDRCKVHVIIFSVISLNLSYTIHPSILIFITTPAPLISISMGIPQAA